MRRAARGVLRKKETWPWYEWVEQLREERRQEGAGEDGVREVRKRSGQEDKQPEVLLRV